VDQSFYDQEILQLRRMSAEEKLLALDALRRTAQLAVEAGLRMRHPDLSPAKVEEEARRIVSNARS